MIPQYAFALRITYRTMPSGKAPQQQFKTYADVKVAVTAMAAFARQPGIKRIELLCTIDDITIIDQTQGG